MNKPKSTSRPTTNRNKLKPRVDSKLRDGRLAGGKMWDVKPGIRPIAVGPSRIPAKICVRVVRVSCKLSRASKVLDKPLKALEVA